MPTAPDAQSVKDAMRGRYPAFYAEFTDLKRIGDELRGPCPLHDGTGPNFAVHPDTGEWFCHSRCQEGGDAYLFLQRHHGLTFPEAIRRLADHAGLHFAHPTPRTVTMTTPKPPPGPIVATYDYTDEDGALLFQVTRHVPKDFRQRRPDGHGGWTWGLADTRRVLYQLPDVAAAVRQGQTIYIVEGEKDADALRALGLCATCNPMGAGKWHPDYTETLCAAGVVLLPDNDEPGRRHAEGVARALHGQAAHVRIVPLPNLPDKGDVSDWLASGGTLAALAALVQSAPNFIPSSPPRNGEGGEERAGRGSFIPWEPPIPLDGMARPPFPVEALPDDLAHYVASVAHTLQVPPDLPALLALAAVAAAGARTCRVQVGTTHAEPLNLYVAAVMEPGSRKSAAMEALAFPLQEAEREMTRDAAPALADARERRAVQEKHQAVLRDKAAKAKNSADRSMLMQELGELAADLTDVPAAPRLLADDVTPEQLATLLSEQNGCMALFSAEGGIFGILAGRYNAGGVNLDLFLKAHAADPYRVDRKGRPAEHIAYPCLTMGLTVQPDVLASLADTPAFRGRGLLGRFLYSLPDSLVGTRLYDEARAVDPSARHRYARTVRALLALPSPVTAEDPGARHPLRLTGAALSVWTEYANQVERRQADGGDLSPIRDWASKLAGAVARIAGGLHLAENAGHPAPWTVPFAPPTVAAAWAIGEYLIPHALAAYGQMGADPRLVLARRILRWIERHGLPHFKRWECHQQMRDVTSAEDLMPALALLCERHYLRPVEAAPSPGRGRPKGPEYEVHPDIQPCGSRQTNPNNQTTRA